MQFEYMQEMYTDVDSLFAKGSQTFYGNEISLHHNSSTDCSNNIQDIEKDLSQMQSQYEIFNLSDQTNNQTISIMGKGGYGEVKQIISIEKGERNFYAEKSFKRDKDYYEELQRYENFQKHFESKNQIELIKEYAILLKNTKSEQKLLQYELGLCSLSEFTQKRAQLGIKWDINEIMYIFHKISKFTILMFENGFFHSDIKPQNIILDLRQSELLNQHDIKIIDFGIMSTTKKFNFQDSCTPVYFYNENRKQLRLHQFQNVQERLRAEIYTIFRTFQEICISGVSDSNDKKKEYQALFNFEINQSPDDPYKKIVTPYQTKNRLYQIMDLIKNNIFNEQYKQNNNFQKFIDGLYMLIEETYNIEQDFVRNFLNNKDIFTDEIINYGVIDNDNMVGFIIQNKMKDNQSKMNQLEEAYCSSSNKVNPLEIFFQLESYIEGTSCTHVENSHHKMDLYETVTNYIAEQNSRALYIIGEGGQGKSTFLIYLQDKFEQLQDKFKVIRVQLQLFTNEDELIKYQKQVFETHITDKKQYVLFLLDGYDELLFALNRKKPDFTQLFKMNEYKNIKFIITGRKCSIDYKDLDQNNSLIEKTQIQTCYICSLTDIQIRSFITKYIQKISKKRYFYNIEVYPKITDYCQKLCQHYNLHQLMSNPLSLKIIAEVLPQIDKQIDQVYQEELRNKKIQTKFMLTNYFYSKHSIYQKFIESWVHRKIDQSFSLNCVKEFLEFTRANLPENASVQQHFQQATSCMLQLNQTIAFQMFQQNLLSFDYEFSKQAFKQKMLREMENNMKGCVSKPHFEFESMHYYVIAQCSPVKSSAMEQNCDNNKVCQKSKHFEYIHKTIYEYLVASEIIQDLDKFFDLVRRNEKITFQDVQQLKINLTLLDVTHKEIILFITSYLQYNYPSHEEYQKLFLSIVDFSRDQQNGKLVETAASNAATIFNALNFKFSGLELQNIRIPYAQMQNACLSQVNLQNADMRYCNFKEACFQDANIQGANLTGVQFGIYPDDQIHQGSISKIRVSQSGKKVVSCSSDKTVILTQFNVRFNYADPQLFEKTKKSKEVTVIREHDNWVTDVNFSHSDRYIVSCSYDYNIIIWDIEQQKLAQKIKKAHSNWLHAVCFTKDDKYVISASQDSSIKVWDWQKGKLIKEFKNHTGPVKCLKPSPKNPLEFTSGSHDNSVKIWNIQNGLKFDLKGHCGWVNDISYSPEGGRIVSCSHDKQVIIWDTLTGQEINRAPKNMKHSAYQLHSSWISSVQYSGNGKFIATGSHDKTVSVLDAETLQRLSNYEGHEGVISCVDFSKCTNFVLSVGSDKVVKIWDTHTPQQVKQLFGHCETITSLYFTDKNANQLIASDANTNTLLWDIKTGIKKNQYEIDEDSQCKMNKVIVSNDKTPVVIGAGCNSNIYIWDIYTASVLNVLKGHSSEVMYISLSQNNKHLISTSLDNDIIIWDWQTKKIIQKINEDDFMFKAILLNDGKHFIVGSKDSGIKLYNIQTQDVVVQIGQNNSQYSKKFQDRNNNQDIYLEKQQIQSCFDMSKDEKYLVQCFSSHPDGVQIQLMNFNAQTLQFTNSQVNFNKTLLSTINEVKISKNSEFIAVGCYDNTIKILSIINGNKLQVLKGHLDTITCLKFSENSEFLISASVDRTIIIWNNQYNQKNNNDSDIEQEEINNFQQYRRYKHIGYHHNKLILKNLKYNQNTILDPPQQNIVAKYSKE